MLAPEFWAEKSVVHAWIAAFWEEAPIPTMLPETCWPSLPEPASWSPVAELPPQAVSENSCSQDCSRSRRLSLRMEPFFFQLRAGFPDTNEKIKGVSDDRFLFR